MDRRITRENCVLVAIDFQEKLVPAIADKEVLLDKTARLVKGFQLFGLPILITQQYTKGLGETVANIKEAAGDQAIYVEKLTFSAWQDETFVAEFKKIGRKTAIVVGIESHVCQQQTVLDLLAAGYTVLVAADCVGSRSTYDRDLSIARMRDAGAVITTYEAILFELLIWPKAEEFKAISALVK